MCRGAYFFLFSASPECKCAPVDLAFIVDSSESIGAENFALSKDFIIAVIDRLMRDQQVKVTPFSGFSGLFVKWLASVGQPTFEQWNIFIQSDTKGKIVLCGAVREGCAENRPQNRKV